MAKELDLTKKLDFGQLLDWTFKIFGKNWSFLLKTISYFIIPGIILLIVAGFFGYQYVFKYFENYMTMAMNSEGAIENLSSYLTEMFGNLGMMIVISWGIMSLYGLFYLAASMASIKAAGQIILGVAELNTKSIVNETLRKFFPVLLTSIVSGLMMTLGFGCCYIPGLILLIYLSFIIQVMMLENAFGFRAIGRSFSLISKNFWPVVLVQLVLYFLYTMAAGLLSLPVFIVPYVKMIMRLIQQEGQNDLEVMRIFMQDIKGLMIIIIGIYVITSILYMLIVNIAITLKYYNIRNIKEGASLLAKLDHQDALSMNADQPGDGNT